MSFNFCKSFLKAKVLAKQCFYNRKLTSWSPVASAFNYKQSKVKSLKSQFINEKTGLFGKNELEEPNGFYLIKDNAVSRAEMLMYEIKSSGRKRKIAKVFDELSDTLCKVGDLAEFVRIGHPEDRFTYAAKEASISISTIVEELNTNRELYDKLKYVGENGDIIPTDSIDDYVTQLFLFDFEQCGIHLDKETREKIVAYNEYILHVGSHFVSKSMSPRVVLKSNIPESIRHCFPADGDTVVVHELMTESKNELLREASYRIFLYPDRHQEDLLNELLEARRKLALFCGFPTYAHRAVRGSLAGSPDFVHEFLRLLKEKIKGKADEDYAHMLKLKQGFKKNATAIMAWDVPYMTSCVKRNLTNSNPAEYTPYFSLGACMEGLNYIFKSLYNVHLCVEDVLEGELWHPDVRKLSVREGEEVLGHIYCDFFERLGKLNQDCHYTIQGGKLCDDGTYQKPIVVLMLNLPNPTWLQPSLLTTSMIDNLFHEMGHAMHSMLARTSYQHITGTRCATDLAEIPSILMEYFASDPRVILKFARHYQTGETIPMELIQKMQKCKNMFQACETQLQVFYAAYDQACHSHNILNSSTTELLARIQNEFYGVPHVPNTAWQLRFGHIVGYGAKYYSYLMSRAVASWIWHEYFKNNPFNREEGMRYRNDFLAHGGSKPPRNLVQNFLGAEITPENLSEALVKDISAESIL